MMTGLRERKRRAIAHDLATAAFDLTVKHGLDGFTIDELTEQAGYARRTFANYYSCKEEAVTALALEQLRAGIASLPELPGDLALIDWVRALAKHQLSQGLMDLLLKLGELTRDNPGLEPYLSRVYSQIRSSALQVVQARFAPDVPPQKISILVGAAYGALTTFLDQLLRGHQLTGDRSGAPPAPDQTAVADFLDAVFDQLKAGF